MPAPIPEPGPDGEQSCRDAAADGWGGPGWAWAEGGAGIGPMPRCERQGPQPEPRGADGLPAGLDYAALVDGLAASGVLGSDADDQDAELAELLAAEEEGRLEPADPAAVAATAVEFMGPGAAQAGWLEVAAGGLSRLDEHDLAGVAIAARQATSRAQAMELAAVAQITARAAEADPRIGRCADGRPERVCRDALGQIQFALKLSPYSAEAWADLAVTLTWRLPATGQALARGVIDLDRADLIAGMTSVLTQEQARSVEQKVLPNAAQLTRSDLRERVARAVIAADPEGAERRRERAERNADVRLYADDDQTATITGSKLPQVLAAAGFARLTALARARKAAGMPGGLGFHRAQLMLAMLLDTLPYIPPADGAPPDAPPPDGDDGPGPVDDGHPDGRSPGMTGTTDPEPADGRGPGSAGQDAPDRSGHDEGTRREDAQDEDAAANAGGHEDTEDGDAPYESAHDDGAIDEKSEDESAYGVADEADTDEDTGHDGRSHDDGTQDEDAHDTGAWDDLPGPRDEDAPPDDGLDDNADDSLGWDPAEDDDLDGTKPAPAWPALGKIPTGPTRRPAGPPDGRPVPGLLDAVVPWTTLAGLSQAAGTLGRIGPITAAQARQLAQAAEYDPGAQWRVIVTNNAGQAIAVARVRRPRYRSGPPRDGPGPARGGAVAGRDGPHPPGAGLVGRITVTITQDAITAKRQQAGRPRDRRRGPPSVADAALRAGARALDRALQQADADATAGGCAHADESPAYRPPPRLREYVTARDVTCRSPVCRQPAWRADLDHTRPYDQHGKTCRCNLGGGCRRDHQLKQHPRWKLEQVRPGWFRWTAPSRRTYTVGPDIYPV